MVRDNVPGAKVTGSVTNPGDFEVTVNGQLIYSKQQTGTFPDATAVSGFLYCTLTFTLNSLEYNW